MLAMSDELAVSCVVRTRPARLSSRVLIRGLHAPDPCPPAARTNDTSRNANGRRGDGASRRLHSALREWRADCRARGGWRGAGGRGTDECAHECASASALGNPGFLEKKEYGGEIRAEGSNASKRGNDGCYDTRGT